MDQEISNAEICRTCLTKSTSLVDIFSITNADGINVAKTLSLITSLKIDKTEAKPSVVCQNCYYQLKEASEFRTKCRLSDKKLTDQTNKPPFLCCTCGKLFLRWEYFNRHNRTHSGNRPYKCQLCPRVFRQRCHLAEHERSHAGVKQYQCTLCPKAFVRYDVWRVHKRSHTNAPKKHDCDACGKMFLGKKDLVKHKKIHVIEYKCKDCSKSFTSNEILVKHVENEHNTVLNMEIESSPDMIWIEPDLNSTYSLNCNLNEMDTLKKKCQECSQDFSTDEALTEHSLKIHRTQKRSYNCSICEKTFKKANLLENHVRNKHNTVDGIKFIACEVCRKVFRSTSDLRKHKNIHEGIKPYSCVFCEKRFTQSSHLRHHIRVHTGEKPYKCAACVKSFTSTSQLTVHMRTHSGDRPYTCSVCGKGCTTSTMLKIHVRTHTGETPYKCDTCSKTFSRSDVLLLHKKYKEH